MDITFLTAELNALARRLGNDGFMEAVKMFFRFQPDSKFAEFQGYCREIALLKDG